MMIMAGRETAGGWWIERHGDAALELRCASEISPAASARVHAAMAALQAAALHAVEELVPGYVSLTVLLRDLPRRERGEAEAAVRAIVARVGEGGAEVATRIVTVPVAYGGDAGADLADVAARTGLAPEEVIARHVAPTYRVAFIGFLPGFPYLMGLDPALHLPRRATPRTRVPAGAVAIGGAQTGIYPVASPGGWHLLGRTALSLFDPAASPPSLLRAGDRVRFRPVSADALARTAVEVSDA
jgi:KipI family sensor histidine kinase inhibitor